MRGREAPVQYNLCRKIIESARLDCLFTTAVFRPLTASVSMAGKWQCDISLLFVHFNARNSSSSVCLFQTFFFLLLSLCNGWHQQHQQVVWNTGPVPQQCPLGSNRPGPGAEPDGDRPRPAPQRMRGGLTETTGSTTQGSGLSQRRSALP